VIYFYISALEINNMKINRFLGIAILAMALSSSCLTAQYYHPVTVTGFTQDVIVNGVGSASTSTTSAVDDASFAYISRDFQATAGAQLPYYGLPVTGQFMTIVGSTPGLTYQLAPYSGSNSLKLNGVNDTGTLTFSTPTAAYNLYFLATGGSGPAVANAVVTFSDATTQTFSALNVADWYGGANAAIQGIGRVNITSNNMEDGGGINPRIYQIPLAISVANQAKTVQSVSFTKASGTGLINIFGISADRYTTCLAPTAVTASAITFTTGTLSWTAPASVPGSYDVYYTSSTVAPNASTTPSQSGITATTAPMSGLTPQTRFHVWVRSNCSGNVGEWAYGTTFLTPCSTYSVPYSENFDTTAVGSTSNTNAPYCWSYLETASFAGSGYVVATNPFVAPNSYVLSNSSATTGNQMLVSPQTISLSDGTKRVRFHARGASANYSLQVGTLTDPTDPTTFTSVSTITLTNAHALYNVNLPNGGGGYLAFRHNLGATSRSIYIDNINVEAIPSCTEAVNPVVTAQGMNSISLSWTDLGVTPTNSYDIYYSTTNTPPTPTVTLNAANSITSNTTSAVVSGLSTDTTYYFWVRSNCSATVQTAWSSSVSSFTGYCRPSSTNQNSWISGFTSTGASINMAYASPSAMTGTNGYQNLSLSGNTILSAPSAATPLTVTVGGGGSYGVAIWVDWDNSLTFSTAERVYATTGYITTPANTTLTIPAGQAVGNYRMRVMCDYNSTSPSNPCATPTRGEFLDFTLQVASQLATSEVGSDKKEIKISPNPFTDVINISEFKDIKTVKIIDLAGRTLQTIENPGKTINLSSLGSGLYLVSMYFKDGSQKSVKVIKK